MPPNAVLEDGTPSGEQPPVDFVRATRWILIFRDLPSGRTEEVEAANKDEGLYMFAAFIANYEEAIDQHIKPAFALLRDKLRHTGLWFLS